MRTTEFHLCHAHRLTRILEPGARFSFELTQERGAALVTRHHTYREDIEHRSVFEEYMKKHYDSWVKFSSKHGSDVRPILVTGVDMTKDFAMIAYANNSTRLSSEFTVSVPLAASASASVWGTWHTEGLVHTNCGPQVCTPPLSPSTSSSHSAGALQDGTIRNEYDQCMFIRYYVMRKRFMFPKVMKGAAGPHDLGPGNNRNETFPELTVQLGSHLDTEPDSGEPPTDVSSPATDYESVLEVVHNVPSVRYPAFPSDCRFPTASDQEEEDPFDMVAEYIFQVRPSHGQYSGSWIAEHTSY